VEAALASGVSLAFLSANEIYWQIRLEPARGSGAPQRTQVCYKQDGPALDPMRGTDLLTVQWRQLGEPENAVVGEMYGIWQQGDADLVVSDASAWPWQGTGARDGDAIHGVVGYECDRTQANGATPAGTQVVARSPVVAHDGRSGWQESAVRVEPNGAFVFAAGTIQWAWGLSRAGHADRRIRVATENLFRRAGLVPANPDPPLP
jgi:N,N-dimethylformamidase beta subunit-like, C-terminal